VTRLAQDISRKAGMPPGSLVHVGGRKAEQARITVVRYNETHYEESEVADVSECLPPEGFEGVTWVNVDGIHDTGILQRIGEMFGLHHLLVEDILNTGQRAKLDNYGDYLFLVVKDLSRCPESGGTVTEQISFVLGHGYVLSFQEIEGDGFDPVRQRLRDGNPRLRGGGADYLVYALLDAVVDNYFVVLEELGERIEDLEDDVLADPGPEDLHQIHELRREMLFFRRSIWPLREVINRMERGESRFVAEETQPYLRDVYDHTIQVIETVETAREMLAGMHDIYLSAISNRMNSVMKVLTIISTIFIPLTFLAGVYGMNFHFMPELRWTWAYPALWAFMIAISLLMLAIFRRKKWL